MPARKAGGSLLGVGRCACFEEREKASVSEMERDNQVRERESEKGSNKDSERWKEEDRESGVGVYIERKMQ